MQVVKKIIEKIKNSPSKKALIENLFSLSALQITSHILTLITLPYLVRVLGMEKFGLISFAWALIQVLLIITDFGFDLSATKAISINREDKEKVSEIFSSVILIKTAMMLICLTALAGLVLSVPKFKNDWLVYILTFGIVIGSTLFPVWFFQGIEKMKYIASINIASHAIFVILIFIFVKNPSDYIYVPMLRSLGFILAGLAAFWTAWKNFRVRIYIPALSVVLRIAKDSFHFFLSRASASIHASCNIFFLGLFASNVMVGYYAAAERLYLAVIKLYTPVLSVMYPHMVKTQDIKFLKKIIKLSFIMIASFSLVTVLFGDHVVKLLYGSGFGISAALLKIFSIALLISFPSALLGYPLLAAFGHAKKANNSIIIGSMFHIISLCVISRISINVYNVAILVVVTSGIVFALRVYWIRKLQLWN